MADFASHLARIDAILHSGDMKTQAGFDAVSEALRAINPWLGSFDLLGGIDVLYVEVPKNYCPDSLGHVAHRMIDLSRVWPYGTLCIAVTRQGRTGHLGRITINDDGSATWNGQTDALHAIMHRCLNPERSKADFPLVG